MDPVTERRTSLVRSALASPRADPLSCLLDVLDYLIREAQAEAWDECNSQWAQRGLSPDSANPYRD